MLPLPRAAARLPDATGYNGTGRGPPSPWSTDLAEHTPPPSDDPDAALKPPQFTLRTMLVVMAAVAGLFAVMSAVGSLWSLAILLFLGLVAAHVAANAAGTKMRDRSVGRPIARRRVETPRDPPKTVASPKRLAEPARLHWIALVMAVGGAVGGGYFGGSALADSYPDATAAAVVVGFVSSGVLGGFAGFATGSFLLVARQAVSEAHAGSDRQQRHPARRPRN